MIRLLSNRASPHESTAVPHIYTIERLWGTSTIYTQLLFGQRSVIQAAVKVGTGRRGEVVVKDEPKNRTITANGDQQLKEKAIGEVLVTKRQLVYFLFGLMKESW